jgi:hypothetical protein
MFLYRNWSILLHHRRRRVRLQFFYSTSLHLLNLYITTKRSVRRIWFWRHSAIIFTGFTCFFCGGILSEFVQAALPVESALPHSSFYILKAKRSLNTSSGVMFWFALSP